MLDQRHAARGRDVLAGGVVAHVQAAGGDDGRESREGAFPECGLHAGALDGALDARGFLSAGAFVDGERRAAGRQQRQEPLFERVGNALGGVLADSQADAGVRTPPLGSSATYGFASGTPNVSSAQAAASSGSARSVSPPYPRLSKRW